MNIEDIINSTLSKSDKMRRLFDEGKTRKEVSLLLGVGYGFVQNVYAKYYNRSLSPVSDFVFDRTFGIELEIVHSNKTKLRKAIISRGIACSIEGYNHITRRHWKIVTDASVHGGYELVSPVLKGAEGLNEVKLVCEALEEVGAI
ncbi:MAG: amidoligase family protein, partial [Opitutales bacterium]|nr:amidoligase family protein [Opitutales bacterium]